MKSQTARDLPWPGAGDPAWPTFWLVKFNVCVSNNMTTHARGVKNILPDTFWFSLRKCIFCHKNFNYLNYLYSILYLWYSFDLCLFIYLHLRLLKKGKNCILRCGILKLYSRSPTTNESAGTNTWRATTGHFLRSRSTLFFSMRPFGSGNCPPRLENGQYSPPLQKRWQLPTRKL